MVAIGTIGQRWLKTRFQLFIKSHRLSPSAGARVSQKSGINQPNEDSTPTATTALIPEISANTMDKSSAPVRIIAADNVDALYELEWVDGCGFRFLGETCVVFSL